MFLFTDNNVLTALQLNGNFAIVLDKMTTTPQTVISPITLSGGTSTTNLTLTGPLVLGGSEVHNTTVLTASGGYVAAASDRYIAVKKITGEATTISLPSGSVIGRVLTIKDAKGDTTINAVILVAASPDLIDGAASYTLMNNYQSIDLLYVGGQWCII